MSNKILGLALITTVIVATLNSYLTLGVNGNLVKLALVVFGLFAGLTLIKCDSCSKTCK